VVDTYYDVKVTDDYQWLEDGSAPEVKQWVAAQNAYTAAYMDKLPQRDAILAYMKGQMKKQHTQYFAFQVRNGKLFALRFDPGAPAEKVVVFDSPENKASEREIVDLAKFEPGKVYQEDWYHVSPDGKLIAMALSTGGSEDGALHVIDTATGKPVGETVPRVQFATGGGDMAWLPDGKGFYYTRYPQGSERHEADVNFYQEVYLHKLGTPASADTYVLGKDFPRIAETTFGTSPDNSRILVNVANGDGGQFEEFVIGPDGMPQQVTHFDDGIVLAKFGLDNSLWLLSHKNSDKGEIVHLPVGDLRLEDAKLVVPASDGSIEGSGSEQGRLFVGADRLYLTVINGGPEEIRAYTLEGKRKQNVPAPEVASISSLVRDGKNAFLFAAETFTAPQQWYRYDGKKQPQALPFHQETEVSLADISVERVFATSKDGTKVPMTILMRKGTKLDGKNPALITGYGGFGISTTPGFYGNRLWFDHGGVLAITNIRGGAEYGESWHLGGNLTNKQNVFDDFAACAEYLADKKYTSPEHLAAEGGSNGGLLMGAMITQHPELFRVVLTFVGIYDMLRTELDPNGSFNVTEYGTVKDPAQFRALYAYSPYHHVVAGTKYPAVLFVTGDNDHRVNPAHSRKMTAELQAATTSGLPVLLLTNANAGHGVSTNVDEALLEEADANAFIFAELGIAMH
jgi:prolyl oligopeptidase